MQLKQWRPCCFPGLLAAVVLLGMTSISLAQGNTWSTKKNMPTARYAHKTCVVNGKIYAMGGAIEVGCNRAVIKTLEEYDPATDTWSRKTDMPVARESFSLNAVNGKIYAIGGHSQTCSQSLRNVAEYDPQTDTWNSAKTSMPTPRGGLSSNVVNGKIYAMGGLNVGTGSSLKTVEEYDPVTDSWTRKTGMPRGRRFFSTAVVEGKIYVFWGYYDTPGATTIDVYDPAMDNWETKDTPVQLGDCAASVVNGLIYVFGGRPFPGSTPVADVWEYNPVSDTWSAMNPMPTARAGAPASEVNGKIYVIGNSTTLWPYLPGSVVEEYTPAGVTAVEDPFRNENSPEEFGLRQNYPNPFNPSTTIEFSLPRASFVTVKVYNSLGEEVSTLVSEKLPAGRHKYNWQSHDLTSGSYFYRITAGGYSSVKKALLLK